MTAPQRLNALSVAETRARKALSLHLAGFTFTRIAEECGYADRSGAYRAVQSILARDYPKEQVEEARAKISAQLQTALTPLWSGVVRGDRTALDGFLKITDRLMRLHGLDAPLKVEITGEVDERLKALTAALDEAGVYVVPEAS